MSKNEKTKTNTDTREKPFILRDWLKIEGQEIRELKEETKNAQRSGKGYASLQSKLHYKRQNFRHHHIACCELFGRSREEIETPRKDNYPNEYAIQSAKERYAWSPEAIKAYKERNEKALCLDSE